MLVLLLQQGLPFRGHDESDTSNNRGNYLELLQLLADHDEKIKEMLILITMFSSTVDVLGMIVEDCYNDNVSEVKELDDRFAEGNTELLICLACLSPNDSFVAFDKEKLVCLAQLYPKDFMD
ncbi:zinc finger MYM-type protein 1-like [Pyrus x bretschneideri]|uniref:zinc finger MYM-type protein 1-like n=1 Tax=Pyrus x bretschneideri TaxID=225117 RepID=UPI002030AA47|nr:zinc finger MYM-type protein 1-like [Pyrus x bretschneideri]